MRCAQRAERLDRGRRQPQESTRHTQGQSPSQLSVARPKVSVWPLSPCLPVATNHAQDTLSSSAMAATTSPAQSPRASPFASKTSAAPPFGDTIQPAREPLPFTWHRRTTPKVASAWLPAPQSHHPPPPTPSCSSPVPVTLAALRGPPRDPAGALGTRGRAAGETSRTRKARRAGQPGPRVPRKTHKNQGSLAIPDSWSSRSL